MQGFPRIIPVADKVRYIRKLLEVGFDTVETGSLVSARLIPQMADSLEVLEHLHHPADITRSDFSGQDKESVAGFPGSALTSKPNLMFLAVNGRGAEKLAPVQGITHISYPFSFTPTFLRLNVNSTVEESLTTAGHVVRLCRDNGKTAVIYISMAFGNPYGDPWSPDLLVDWVGRLYDAGARIIPLSNVANEIDASLISKVYSTLIPAFPEIEFGLHLHTANQGWYEKTEAAWEAGCRRFDGVINGWGGCPMAGKEMLGNLMTENLIEFAARKGIPLRLDVDKLSEVYQIAKEVFKS